jgi:cytidylate kinase
MKLNKKIKIGIDSPSAAGAGTISKLLAKHYNLLYCDTGKIYRFLAKNLMTKKPKNKYLYLKKISKKINLKKLKNKNLLTNEVAYVASQIAKEPNIRKLVVKFQKNLAYHPPKKFNGSILDGRDINSKIIKDADFKFYITATTKCRANRRVAELRKLGKKIKFADTLKSIKKRDREDRTRRHSRLKKTKDSYLINTTNLSIKSSFLKVKKIIDSELNKIWKK